MDDPARATAFPGPVQASGRDQLLQGAACLTLAGALAFIFLFVVRRGLGDDPRSVAMLFGMTVLPVWASAGALAYFGRSALGAAAALAVSFLVALVLPIAGLIVQPGPILMSAVLALTVLPQVPALCRALVRRPIAILVAMLAFTAAMLLFNDVARFFLPENIALGLAHSDNYYNTAISHVLERHRAISIGGDGLALHSYHFLSHLIAAALSHVSAASVAQVYLYWAALSLKLQLVWALFAAGLLLAPGRDNALIARLFYAWLVALLVGSFDSESFLQGAALYASLVPAILALAKRGAAGQQVPVAPLVIVLVGTLFCAFAKLSAGFFAGIGLVVVLWHIRQQRSRAVLLVLGLLCLVPPVYALVLPKDLGSGHASFILLAGDYYNYLLSAKTLASFAAPVLLFFVLAFQPSAVRDRNSIALRWMQPSLDWRSWTPAAQLAALSLVGCLLVLLTQPIGSNMAYFSLYLFLLSLLMFPGAVTQSGLSFPLKLGRRIAISAFSLMLLGSLFPFYGGMAALLAIYRAANEGKEAYHTRISAEMRQSWQATGTLFSTLKAQIAATPWEDFIRGLNARAASRNGAMAVHIAPDAQDVWRRLEGHSAWWCMAPQLMIPAEAGLVEIRSMAPKAVEQECAPPGMLWYGFGKDQDAHRTASLSDTELCRLARPLRVREVYVVHSYREPRRNRAIACESR